MRPFGLIIRRSDADGEEVKVVIGRLFGGAVVALGLATLAGWALEREALTDLGWGHTSLKVNTAVCFVLLGSAAALLPAHHWRLRAGLEIAAGAIALATVFEHLWDSSLGIDELLLNDPFATAGTPGRMSLGSAIALALIALGMLMLGAPRRAVRVSAHPPLLVAGSIGFVGLVGYASGLDELHWKTDVASMSIHAAGGILLLVASALVLAPVEGIVAVVLRPSAGGRLLRRLVPAAVLVPAAFMVPIGRGATEGLFGFDVGVLLFFIGTVVVSLLVLFWTARSLDRAAAERERLLAESRAVLDAATDGILMTDLEGEVLFSNAAMATFWDHTGLVGSGTIWERIARLSALTTSPATYHRLLESVALDPEREHVGEFTLASSGRSFVGRTAPVPGADGTLMGRIFSLRETTTERAAARAKEEFVATVSHELRTPLAAISGYAELLEDDVATVDVDSVQFLEVIQRNAQRLARLVDDLLLLQQSDEEGVSISLGDVELRDVVRQSIERVEPAANRKAIEIAVEGDQDGLVLIGDAMRLGQVVDNLLSNAVKFTPEGGRVTVRIARTVRACTVEVEDSGPGIPEDERGRVFERFFRSRDAVARSIPGTGLGLVVSRRIAEAHGGVLELVDGARPGTTFRLVLPITVVAAATE